MTPARVSDLLSLGGADARGLVNDIYSCTLTTTIRASLVGRRGVPLADRVGIKLPPQRPPT